MSCLQPEKFWVDDTVLPDEWALFSPRGFRGPITKAELVCYCNNGQLTPDTFVCHNCVRPDQRCFWRQALEDWVQRWSARDACPARYLFPSSAPWHLPSCTWPMCCYQMQHLAGSMHKSLKKLLNCQICKIRSAGVCHCLLFARCLPVCKHPAIALNQDLRNPSTSSQMKL